MVDFSARRNTVKQALVEAVQSDNYEPGTLSTLDKFANDICVAHGNPLDHDQLLIRKREALLHVGYSQKHAIGSLRLAIIKNELNATADAQFLFEADTWRTFANLQSILHREKDINNKSFKRDVIEDPARVEPHGPARLEEVSPEYGWQIYIIRLMRIREANARLAAVCSVGADEAEALARTLRSRAAGLTAKSKAWCDCAPAPGKKKVETELAPVPAADNEEEDLLFMPVSLANADGENGISTPRPSNVAGVVGQLLSPGSFTTADEDPFFTPRSLTPAGDEEGVFSQGAFSVGGGKMFADLK